MNRHAVNRDSLRLVCDLREQWEAMFVLRENLACCASPAAVSSGASSVRKSAFRTSHVSTGQRTSHNAHTWRWACWGRLDATSF